MERLWKSDQGDGTYQNPILFADYSDPDVIRVGDTYYMTASSFNYIPGLPVLTSRDLVNWKLVNYALEEIDYEAYNIPQHSKGVWAPAIRFHEGRFYIYYGMPDEGIFMVSAADPLGKWEKPVLVMEGKGLIDSCPFWDEDGRAYLIHGYAKSRIGFKSYLGIFPLSWDGKKAEGEDHLLYNGVETQPTIEGPKVYKKNGYYYIFAPAGGVKTGWQTVLRAKNIYGPYEEKIVMRQGNSVVNGPHQGALVDTVTGQEWFLHFQDRGLYGRIIHLQPVKWENDWPIIGINEKDGCGEPCLVHQKPDTGISEEACYLEASDDFQEEKLRLQWQWLGNEGKCFYSLKERPGWLRLYAQNPAGSENRILWEEANVLTQKLVCPSFRAETSVEISSLKEGEKAGMIMMGGHYAYLAVQKQDGRARFIFGRAYEELGQLKEKIKVLQELPEGVGQVQFSFTMEEGTEKPVFRMFYQAEKMAETEVPTDFVPSDHTWVGAKLGLFAVTAAKEPGGGYADFEWMKVSAL